MQRLVSFLKTLMYVVLVSLILLGWGRVKVIAKAASWSDNFFNDQIDQKKISNDVVTKIIDDYLQENNSPMVGTGEIFVSKANEYHFPVYLMVAMAGAESNFGKSGYTVGTFNPVGLGIHEGRFYTSWEEGINDFAYVLRNYYFDEGLDDPLEIQNKWAPRGIDGNGWDNSWANNVEFFMGELAAKEKEISV